VNVGVEEKQVLRSELHADLNSLVTGGINLWFRQQHKFRVGRRVLPQACEVDRPFQVHEQTTVRNRDENITLTLRQGSSIHRDSGVSCRLAHHKAFVSQVHLGTNEATALRYHI